jgi:heme peroxidase
MPTKKISRAKAPAKPAVRRSAVKPPSFEEPIQKIAQTLATPIAPKRFRNPSPLTLDMLKRQLAKLEVTPSVEPKRLLESLNRINPKAGISTEKMPEEIRASVAALKPTARRFHGTKVPLIWFPFPWISAPCSDKFGYLTPASVRASSRLPFNPATQLLLGQLGDLMADAGRETAPDSTIPAGYTYFGQFVDHDVTLDVSSSLVAGTDANTLNNMRSPALDLDSVYGRGPALDPFLYVFPSSGPPSAIKLALGTNRPSGPGGPGGSGGFGGMTVQADYDVPRMNNPLNPAASTLTAVVGDPRNDENLIVSQFHHSMLKFHNEVVDMLLLVAFPGDIFVEAKKIVTQHYQWAVVNDFLTRVCGPAAVASALASATVPIGSPFRMPVEFSVAAYRFGHSMIRDRYWLNFIQINASLADVFAFNRKPNLPVLSNWAVDFNAFFTTGVVVPVNNKARPIDSNLANKLEALPDFTGLMAILATRNLRRGLALGLPSGQATATFLGVPPMTSVQLKQGLPANEVTVLNSNGGLLLKKTPLWYYVLREAAVLGGGNQMGPLGAKIVADTFVRMLSRDAGSYLNVTGGFTPFLPSATPGDFTVADLVIFAGVTQP